MGGSWMWGPGMSGPRMSGPHGIAEFAEDLAEPVVNRLEDGRAVGELDVVKRGKPGDGLVDPIVSSAGARVPGGIERLWVHCSLLLRLQLTSAGSAMRYSPRVNGTAQPGARHT
jgi:hypothetical protein